MMNLSDNEFKNLLKEVETEDNEVFNKLASDMDSDNEEFNFELSTKEDIMKMVDILETNKPKITIANFTISLNPFIMLDFKGLTNCDYFDTLYRLFKEAKDFNNLILIAEKICGEQVEEYTNETLSGVLNYLMSELSEKLAANKCYNGKLIDLLLYNN